MENVPVEVLVKDCMRTLRVFCGYNINEMAEKLGITHMLSTKDMMSGFLKWRAMRYFILPTIVQASMHKSIPTCLKTWNMRIAIE